MSCLSNSIKTLIISFSDNSVFSCISLTSRSVVSGFLVFMVSIMSSCILLVLDCWFVIVSPVRGYDVIMLTTFTAMVIRKTTLTMKAAFFRFFLFIVRFTRP